MPLQRQQGRLPSMWKCAQGNWQTVRTNAAFSDISGRSETSVSPLRIDNPGNDEGRERLGQV